MAKVVRIKPVDAGTVRVEFGVKMEDLKTALEFNNSALKVFSKERELLYEVALGGTAAFGKTVMVIPDSPSTEEIVFLIHNVDTDISTNSALANFVKYGAVVKTQIDKAIKEYNEAAKLITVEGE